MYTVERWSANRDVYVYAFGKAGDVLMDNSSDQTASSRRRCGGVVRGGDVLFSAAGDEDAELWWAGRIEASAPLFPDYVILHGSAADVADAEARDGWRRSFMWRISSRLIGNCGICDER